MLSMKGREKYKKAVERMRALGCESQEEIIAGLENEIDRMREQMEFRRASRRISINTTVHELKIMPEFYEAVLCGDKTFEIRKNDRGFIVGDFLVLKEWDGENFTGRTVTKKISYMVAGIYGLRPGYCVLGIVEPNVYEMCKAMEKILNDAKERDD